jgi:serine/threonine protein kinase/tetratricopeptide (TPR) repeat protein
MMLEPGQSFAQFRIIRQVDEGGMGEVYLAEDRKLSREVALKILRQEFFKDSTRLERFYREARVAAKISHPNVMSIYHIDTVEDRESGDEITYIVMEYIPGETLTDYLANRNPAVDDRLRIAESIAGGLAAAHKLNIVHRDIKLDNILIDKENEPRILDFGLAKPLEAIVSQEEAASAGTVSRDITREDRIIGTVSYMSPEQARGENIDIRSDIFSFGIVLYRIFTGELPFDGPDRISTIAKILESPHVPVRCMNDALPPEIERIITKCLQKNPDDRYQDTRDLFVDLRSLRRQYERTTGEMDTVYTVDSTGEKNNGVSGSTVKKLYRFAGALIVGLVVLSMLSIFAEKTGFSVPRFLRISRLLRSGFETSQGLQARENALAILGFENKTGDAGLDWLTAGLPEMLLTDLAQSGTSNIIGRNRILDYLSRGEADYVPAPDCKEMVDAAGSLGASTALSGSFYMLNDRIRIDARLEEIETGHILLAEKVIGDDPFMLVDSLTGKVAQSLNLKDILVEDQNIATLTSSSPDAYKQYILGIEKFKLSRYDEAIEFFERAVEIDSTFVLPYMRIGMVQGWRSRQLLAASYIEKALRYGDRLPRKERNILDIYADFWLREKFDEAFVKMKVYLDNYPEDREMRSMYALFLFQSWQDHEHALRELDTVLSIDPRDPMALMLYSEIHKILGNYDQAIDYSSRLKKHHPESVSSYFNLAVVFTRTGRYDDAIEECRELLRVSPGHPSALWLISRIYIHKRDFPMARSNLDRVRELYPDDRYLGVQYYQYLANLSSWEGAFGTALEYLFDALEQSRATGDSTLISQQLFTISTFYHALAIPDSAKYYGKKAFDFASTFQKLNYPSLLIQLDRRNETEARSIFDDGLQKLKSRIPSEMWEMSDIFSRVFEGYCTEDTAAIIAGYEEAVKKPYQDTFFHFYEIGRLSVLTGDYGKGKSILKRILVGPRRTASAWGYIQALHYIGRANEGLGLEDEARRNYEEVLRYWADADRDLEMVEDTKERLIRLNR